MFLVKGVLQYEVSADGSFGEFIIETLRLEDFNGY